MLLPDHEIHAAITSGHIRVDPYDPSLVQPASLDIRLGDRFHRRVPADGGPLGVWLEGPTRLPPGAFLLGHTLETVTLPDDIAARVEGRSTLGRIGLLTHATAGWVDPGFHGSITLELANLSAEPITLTPGQSIGQLCFFRMASPVVRPYGSPGLGSKYQGQQGPTPARGPLASRQAS